MRSLGFPLLCLSFAASCGTDALTPPGNLDGGNNGNVDFAGTTVDITLGVPPDLTMGTKPVDMTIIPPGSDLTMVMTPPDLTSSGPVDLTQNGIVCGASTCNVGDKCCVMRSGMTTTESCMAS